ncbi:hypothetical protein C5167_042949 [Papaver somniferum]|uniref:Uncharacterized protein n=2 Tax=Papaver somniferum TaxID=3469 RepID=A0A4Y7L859_PAPSO|nr:hypothetical protein C5167_042949 [Papaver somniferum]
MSSTSTRPQDEIMANEAPSWADQWGAGGIGAAGSTEEETKTKSKKDSNSSSKKMADMKATAAVGLDKAKSATVVGAQKVKAGASAGVKWIKTLSQKKSSSK